MPLKGFRREHARFDLLLDCIGEAAYDALRRRLILYFRWEQFRDPDLLADEVIDRLARRAGEDPGIANWNAYAAGVARMLAKEQRAAMARERTSLNEIVRRQDGLPDGSLDIEADIRDLEDCLSRFTAEQRSQIMRYYAHEEGSRSQTRRRLGTELGLRPVALRNRMLRLRKLLAECMSARSQKGGMS